MLPCIVTCEHVGVIVPCSEDDVLSQLWARGCNPTESVHLLLVWAGYWHKTVLSSKKECLATGDCPRSNCKQCKVLQQKAARIILSGCLACLWNLVCLGPGLKVSIVSYPDSIAMSVLDA